ncbi:MAG: HD domain-containing protein [Candidatus Caldatribacterium sp.]|nr:HD domain-containing protein [Candidatus Caldatribacterium sp.]
MKYDLLAHFSRVPLPILNHLYLATWKGNAKVLGILKEGLAKFSKEEIDNLLKPYVVELETHPPWLGSVIAVLALGTAAFIGILSVFNRLLKRRVAQATKSLREAEQKLLKTVEVVASLPLFSVKEEVFLSRILDLALELIPKASSGSVLLVDESGRGKIVAVRGHDEGLVGFTFEKEDLIVFDKVMVVQDILNPKRKFSSKERFERLVALSRPISETLGAPFFWKEKFFGHLTLDIPKGDKEHFNEEDIALVEQFARICVAFHALREYAQKEESLLEGLLLALAKALEYYDGSTRMHSEVSAGYAFEIARSLGLDEERARLVRWAALVHDVGKIFIPQEILRKPARLTPEEYDLVKLHAIKGEELLLSIKGLESIARIVRHHHERFDGTGYPDGLRGEEIPLEARILAVVDAFEAMTSDRPYRRAMSVDEALEELKRFSGTQFDPEVVRVMVAVVEEQIEYSRGRD